MPKIQNHPGGIDASVALKEKLAIVCSHLALGLGRRGYHVQRDDAYHVKILPIPG